VRTLERISYRCSIPYLNGHKWSDSSYGRFNPRKRVSGTHRTDSGKENTRLILLLSFQHSHLGLIDTDITACKRGVMEACRGNEGRAPLILNLGTECMWVLNRTPRPIYPRGKSSRCPFNRTLLPHTTGNLMAAIKWNDDWRVTTATGRIKEWRSRQAIWVTILEYAWGDE